MSSDATIGSALRPDGLLRNVSWLGAASVAVKPLWFVFITVVCIRLLEVEAYGRMNVALWTMTIAASLTDLGTSDYVTREVSRRRHEAPQFFSNFLAVRVIAGLLVLGLAIATGLATGMDQGRLLAFIAAGLYAMALLLTTFCRVFFRAFEVLRFEALSLVIEKVLVVGVGVTLLYVTRSAEGTLLGMAVGMVIAFLVTAWWVHARIAPIRPMDVRREFLFEHLRATVPLGIFSVFVVAYLRMGPLVLEYFHGEAAVGEFGAAFRIVEGLLLVPTLLIAALLPRVSREFADRNMPAVHRIVFRYGGALVVGTGLVGAALALWGPELMGLVVRGSDAASYAESGHFLALLGPLYPILCLNVVLSGLLIATDQQRFLARFMTIATLVTAVFHLALVKPFGAYGMLAVLAASEIVVTCWFYVVFIRRTRGR